MGSRNDFLNCLLKAEQGDSDAQCKLGMMYDEGQGVVQDYKEAVKWYRKSAEQGDSDAQYNLGVSYDEGEGVIQDYKEAVKWYRKASEQGNSSAQYNLGYMYKKGQGVRKNHKESVKWYRKAAEQGHSDAQNSLRDRYNNEEGVSKDYMSTRMIFILLLVSVGCYISADVIDDLAKNQLQRMEYKIQKECNYNISKQHILFSTLLQMGLGPSPLLQMGLNEGLKVTQSKCVDRVWENTKWQDKWLIERLE